MKQELDWIIILDQSNGERLYFNNQDGWVGDYESASRYDNTKGHLPFVESTNRCRYYNIKGE